VVGGGVGHGGPPVSTKKRRSQLVDIIKHGKGSVLPTGRDQWQPIRPFKGVVGGAWWGEVRGGGRDGGCGCRVECGGSDWLWWGSVLSGVFRERILRLGVGRGVWVWASRYL